jgi:serine/threonine protein kinase
MASVYAAERTRPDGSTMPVACKYMRADLRDHPRLVALFFQEAALGLALSPGHAGLVGIFDCFQDADENLCLVMELVDGCTARDLLDVHGPLPHAAVRAIARQVLSALAYLHAAGVVHRDVSPCNVLVSLSGAVKLSDLGLAKLVDSGSVSAGCFRGKPTYASPEQLTGHKVDGRSDLFSLGVVLYRLLSGRLPFGNEGAVDVMLARILETTPPALPADVPDDLRALTMGLLAAAPEARAPVSADLAVAALDAGAAGGTSMASTIELAAMVIQARSRRDLAATANPEAADTPSSSALTQSFPGQTGSGRRAGRRVGRWAGRWWLGALLGLGVLLGLALAGGHRLRSLLWPASASTSIPASMPTSVPVALPGPPGLLGPHGPSGPGNLSAATSSDNDRARTQTSGHPDGAASAQPPAPQPRTPHTARRAPSRFFVPRD